MIHNIPILSFHTAPPLTQNLNTPRCSDQDDEWNMFVRNSREFPTTKATHLPRGTKHLRESPSRYEFPNSLPSANPIHPTTLSSWSTQDEQRQWRRIRTKLDNAWVALDFNQPLLRPQGAFSQRTWILLWWFFWRIGIPWDEHHHCSPLIWENILDYFLQASSGIANPKEKRSFAELVADLWGWSINFYIDPIDCPKSQEGGAKLVGGVSSFKWICLLNFCCSPLKVVGKMMIPFWHMCIFFVEWMAD